MSQQLRRLEDIVGEPLLRRTPSGVLPTRAGEALLPYAERVLTLSAEGLAAARRGKELRGHCGVGLMEDFATASFSAALAEFAAGHPNVALEIVMLPGPAMRSAFDSGRVQLVLGDTSYIRQEPSRSAHAPLVWTATPKLEIGRGPLPLVLFSEPCRWREPVLRALDAAGRPWQIVFECTNLAGILAALSAGIGITALMPGSLAAGLAIFNREPRLPDLPDVEISLVRRPGTDGDKLIDAIERLLTSLV